MSTVTEPVVSKEVSQRRLVEMNWDPITRIVGSLGIYTKIDFANRQVAECHSTSSIFRGYSIFMKGKDPRDAHLLRAESVAFAETITQRVPAMRRTWRLEFDLRTWVNGSQIWVRPRNTCSTIISTKTIWLGWTFASRWCVRRTRECWLKRRRQLRHTPTRMDTKRLRISCGH